MKIGILQTGIVVPELAQEHGQYPEMFMDRLSHAGFTFETWSVVNGEFPPGPEAADGWLITGSRHGVYEDHAWLPPLEEFIRQIVAAGKPLVGICFGHQVIAQALGGTAVKYPGGWAVGPQTYEFEGRGPKTVMAWHQDQVTDPPEGSVTLASNDFCRHAALLYPGKAYTVQPHPEFDCAFTKGLIDKRGRGVVPEQILQEAEAGLDAPLDSAELIDDLIYFLKHKRLPQRAA
ncbi:GMP synthase-Glutamine amidotransferase [Mameliella alba]|uniref:type 1 glutamine amidotransferase n=1 Tax=Mameliella alba TaxID=561184 RepID=UPI000881C19C|nr:type 1 glutamine amidotransferase [Mameliella alba]OWV48138.1 glutamine amidotransferase [Mameliella alba]PTR40169.1 GMP synthase-like glutamine amidotransferase [Mameliella alba]GGF42811.1 glutamine amidotransferase [Mameliella alba]SDC94621.1 GMP synthase-Glutamine amidotransferase [Mameliella alba]